MDPLPLLKDLIAIPSVNPMGLDVSGDQYFEGRLTTFLENFFDQLGVTHEKVEVLPDRHNLLARFDGGGDGPTILFDAHQDTVPVEGMVIDPFDPVVKDGRLSGRGACDVKGGMAAMLAAFARLVQENPPGAATVIMSCSCDEESTARGVKDLVQLWTDPQRAGTMLSSAPDMAVVAEPTDLDVVVAHRGATRWKIRTTGRACHSSVPSDGINAIYKMANVVACLERYADHLAETIPPHPMCGPATINIGRIEGGLSVNTVPDRCEIEIDRRVIPGENGEAIIGQVTEYLQAQTNTDFEMLEPWLTGMPLPDDNNTTWADRLLKHIATVAGPHKKVGVAYGTNASRIAATGVPAIVFGPGSVQQAHVKDEWIDIQELQQAADVYYRFCAAPLS